MTTPVGVGEACRVNNDLSKSVQLVPTNQHGGSEDDDSMWEEFRGSLARAGMSEDMAGRLLLLLDRQIEHEIQAHTQTLANRAALDAIIQSTARLQEDLEERAKKLQAARAQEVDRLHRQLQAEVAASKATLQDLQAAIASSVHLDLDLEAKRLDEQRLRLERALQDAREHAGRRLDEAHRALRHMQRRIYQQMAVFGGTTLLLFFAFKLFFHLHGSKSPSTSNAGTNSSHRNNGSMRNGNDGSNTGTSSSNFTNYNTGYNSKGDKDPGP
jgi:hypothetical protein